MTHLPELAPTYSLDAQSIETFRRDGHVCLRDVATADEVAAYRPAIHATADRFGQDPDTPLEARDTYGKAFLQHMNLWVRDETVKRFSLAPRFGRIAAELLGVAGVRLYHDQGLFKEAGGGFTPWHQDEYYWPLDTDHTVTMWMPLVDITAEMGMLTFASGSHKGGYLGTLPISDESDQVFDEYVAEKGFTITRADAMAAGDATFHYGWTLHCAPGNESERLRDVMTVIFFADGTRASEPINDNQRNDLRSWLPGAAPGDVVDTHLNPLVWHRDWA